MIKYLALDKNEFFLLQLIERVLIFGGKQAGIRPAWYLLQVVMSAVVCYINKLEICLMPSTHMETNNLFPFAFHNKVCVTSGQNPEQVYWQIWGLVNILYYGR